MEGEKGKSISSRLEHSRKRNEQERETISPPIKKRKLRVKVKWLTEQTCRALSAGIVGPTRNICRYCGRVDDTKA